ncbi:hypothetical protein CFN78_09895 [Amycolatopsis antarctica]|uniref:DUF1841 family protein n=1 Tax=Amycolatopsis antarctica TaxID=1854586 RepID=A0A263D4Q8_9PSEU|nr:hypothetical protein [Amycolatopsis antarctica]OZM73179.1 hypothetical protein CFN78_09895 [Amycolatopsis antarctica]
MSPVSRGRKKTPKPPSANAELDGVFGDVLRDFIPLAAEPDVLQVELFTSELIGEWWRAPEPYDDPERTVGLGLVRYAGRTSTPAGVALLRAMAALAVTDEQRSAAAQAATLMAERGLAVPDWADAIGTASPTGCWESTDVYGDQTTLLLTFDRAGRSHGIAAVLDANHLGGCVEEAFCTEEPDGLLADLRAQAADSEGLLDVRPIDASRARALIERGLDLADVSEVEPGEVLVANRALVLARCRLLPAADVLAEPVKHTDAERDAIVTEFLTAIEETDADAATCARLIVDFGCDLDEGRPLRVGPGKLAEFLEDWVPNEIELTEEQAEALPDVVRAWAGWAGGRSELSAHAVAELLESAEESIQYFEDGPADDEHLDSYLEGVATGADDDLVEETLARRRFAVPETSAVVGVDDFPDLDPADEDERYLLVLGEHPEYHDALADPEFDGEIDGVDPHLFIAVKQVLVNQLWADDPEELWPAVVALAEAEHDRDEIFDVLGRLVLEYLAGALTGEQDPDIDGYRAALRELAL